MSLQAISPIDGRYRSKVESLSQFFSEASLIKYRVLIEVEYFIALSESGISQLQPLSSGVQNQLRNLYKDFSLEDAQAIKDIEKTTNHDVKAVEYFLKTKFDDLDLASHKEFIHFGLTSQDINNTAIPLSIKEAVEEVYYPEIEALIQQLDALATDWEEIPMLARTHGQPASPTRLGKEFKVFVVRLQQQLQMLKEIPHAAKFGGATGNYNAHHVAFPQIDWKEFGSEFVENRLGLTHSFPTTQIEHYDFLAALFDGLKRINTILVDLDRDIWTYISMDYFKQKIKAGEIGSSAMPHKVNPIDFENSEGNLGIANALFEHLAAKLPVSRLQRDLTDSTVLRNVGVPLAHTIIAFKATAKGLSKLLLNEQKIAADLDNNWAVVAEAIQTILRREAFPNPYEALKELTRTNEKITAQSMATFIDQLDVDESIKSEMRQISPSSFTGI
jgi:adenylosuccinate lyase